MEVQEDLERAAKDLIPSSSELVSTPERLTSRTDGQSLDVNAVWDYVESGGEIATGNTRAAEQDIIEAIGKAPGVTYADDELLHTTEKIEHRDKKRWELDPASPET
jgi:hypothetical protein